MILIGKREIIGTLRGYDDFMNLVLDKAKEVVNENQVGNIGIIVIRGNSIVQIEEMNNDQHNIPNDDQTKPAKSTLICFKIFNCIFIVF